MTTAAASDSTALSRTSRRSRIWSASGDSVPPRAKAASPNASATTQISPATATAIE